MLGEIIQINFFSLNDRRSSVHGVHNNLGKVAKGDDDDVEACTVQAALGEVPNAASLSANSDKEGREKTAVMTDEGLPFSSNDVVDGFHRETTKVNQLFQPNISDCVKKLIANNQVPETENSLILLQNKFKLLSQHTPCCSLGQA